MDESQYWIPRHLDAPPLLFLWEADSAMLVITLLIMGGLLNMFIVGVVLAYFVGRGYQQLKEEGGRGLITKVLYWHTPSDIWLGRHLPSHQREWVG